MVTTKRRNGAAATPTEEAIGRDSRPLLSAQDSDTGNIDQNKEKTTNAAGSSAFRGITGRGTSSILSFGPIQTAFLVVALAALATAIVAFNLWRKGNSMPMKWWYLLFLGMMPVGLSAVSALESRTTQPHQRLISSAVVGAVIGNQFPRVISVALAAIGLTLFGLSTRKNTAGLGNTNGREKLKAVFAALFLAMVLLTDNFFVWVVAATYLPSHTGSPQPLQDNGRILQTAFFEGVLELNRRKVQQLRAILNVPWVLVAAAGAALASVDVGLVRKRTLWGVTIRTLLCLAALRTIRVISFVMTVLPSQMPDCYRHHFPPPPKEWIPWLMVGLVPNSHGGCNDLIVSGHATVTSVLACLATSVCGSTRFSFVLWVLLTIDFLIEVYEGFHYSVDMWLGALITTLLWRILKDLESQQIDPSMHLNVSRDVSQDASTSTSACIDTDKDKDTRKGTRTEPSVLPHSSATNQTVAAYCIPAIYAYIVVVMVPESIANYCLIVGLVAAAVMAVRTGYTPFLQHTMFCMLFVTLCVYL